MPAQSTTATIWEKVLSYGKGTIFTGPDVRKGLPKEIKAKDVANRLYYLTKIGVLEKVNVWTGDNYIEYRLLDDTKRPKTLDVSKLISKSKLYVPGKGLYTQMNKAKSPDLVVAIDHMANQLTALLTVAKTHPQATISNFTTEELFVELSKRTSPKN